MVTILVEAFSQIKRLILTMINSFKEIVIAALGLLSKGIQKK